MPEYVRRDAFVPERWLLRSGRGDVLGQDTFEAGARHVFAPSVEKQLRSTCLAANSKPSTNRISYRLPEPERSLATSFAAHAQVNVAPVELHLVDAQANELGDAETSAESEDQHRAVPDAEARGGVGRVEQSTVLVSREVWDEARVGFLRGNRRSGMPMAVRYRCCCPE